MKFSSTGKLGFSLFIGTLVGYLATIYLISQIPGRSTAVVSEDTLPAAFLPVSLIRDGDFFLDEYEAFFRVRYPNSEVKESLPFYVRALNGHLVSAFPVVAPLLAVPVYLPLLFISPNPSPEEIMLFARIAAAFIAACAVLCWYWAVLPLVRMQHAFWLSVLLAFGTSAWVVLSQGLWQHTPVFLFLSLSMGCLLRLPKNDWYGGGALLFLTVAGLARPPVFIISGLFYGFIFMQQRFRSYLPLAAAGVFSLVFLQALYNYAVLGSFSEQSYSQRDYLGKWTGGFPEGFLGMWVSPSKGIFIYTPIFLLIVVSISYLIRQKRRLYEEKLLLVATGAVLCYTLVMGKWYHWYGGWSFSYRLALDTLPLLMVLTIPAFVRVTHRIGRIGVYLLVGISFFIQCVGVLFADGEWHARFDDGPTDTQWLWSVRESELVFYGKKTFCKLTTTTDEGYQRCLREFL